MTAARNFDWLAWWQILRVANVFTAASNVIACYLLVQRDWHPIAPLALLVLASMLLYEGGMVLNDVCDADVDARERPERPIPSGRLNRQTAKQVAIALLAGGVASALAASGITNQWVSALIAIALTATIIAYNARVKSTAWGPFAMGGCRMLNVLLGASVADDLWNVSDHPEAWLFAASVGVYTIGLTLIAKREAEAVNRTELMWGSVLVFVGVAGIAILSIAVDQMAIPVIAWIGAIALLVCLVGQTIKRLLRTQLAGPAVGSLIRMFVVIDAIVAGLACGYVAALAVLSLSCPMRWLARRAPMT